MPFYVLQDSDWDWDAPDFQGVIARADGPREAAEKIGPTLDCDGANLKVAEVNLIGFIDWERDTGAGQFIALSPASRKE